MVTFFAGIKHKLNGWDDEFWGRYVSNHSAYMRTYLTLLFTGTCRNPSTSSRLRSRSSASSPTLINRRPSLSKMGRSSTPSRHMWVYCFLPCICSLSPCRWPNLLETPVLMTLGPLVTPCYITLWKTPNYRSTRNSLPRLTGDSITRPSHTSVRASFSTSSN